jgi:hypothetical protein
MIHHRLIIMDAFHGAEEINAAYLRTKVRAERFLRTRRWSSYLWLVQRPYRLEAFCEIQERLADKTYWSLLGEMWIDTEAPGRLRGRWLTLLRSQRPHRERMMDPTERRALRAMPAELHIFRGYDRPLAKRGISWTLSQEKATWFASRFKSCTNDRRQVVKGTCKKRDVIAYFQGRNEEEILIDPAHVRNMLRV